MINIIGNIIGTSGALGGGASYNAIIQAWISELIANTIDVPDAPTLNALNTLTNSWPTEDALFMFAGLAATYPDAATVSLFNPTIHVGSFVSSPNLSNLGVKGDGGTSYFDCGFIPGSGGLYTLNACNRSWYLEEVPTIGTAMEGAITTSARNHSVYNAATQIVRSNSGSNNLSATVDTTGVGYKAVNRSSSTNVSFYNGLVKSDRTETAVSILAENQTVGKAGTSFNNGRYGYYSLGGNQSEAIHNLKRSLYLAYKTTLGL